MLFRSGDYDLQRVMTMPAGASAALWRLIAGVMVMWVTYLALLWLGAGAFVRITGAGGQARLRAMSEGATPMGLTALLLSFGLLAAGLAVALRYLHQRGLAGVIGPAGRARHDFRRVALALIGLSLVFLPVTLMSSDVTARMTLVQQMPYWPLALLGLLIQTGTEEMVFRGYLQSQLAARFRSPLVWIGVPSALFGLTHFNPETYGPNAWAVVVWATVFGALAADLTARTGSLGAAIGMHFATNFGAIFLVGVSGNLDGLALFTVIADLKDPSLMAALLGSDLMALLVSWLLARVMLRR